MLHPFRARTFAKWVLLPASLMLSGAVVWVSSYSAFALGADTPQYHGAHRSGVHANGVHGNGVKGSGVHDSPSGGQDDNSAPMFSASNLKPGDTASKCVVVTSVGTLASIVKLYATGYSSTSSFGNYIDLVIDEGAGETVGPDGPISCVGFVAGANDFTGTLAEFAAAKDDLTGMSTWARTRSGSESKTFRFTYTINSSTPNSQQVATAVAGLT